MSAWTLLGITRTDDIADIRRAYARKLKAIDVDADPAAFIALREAFNRAREESEGRRYWHQPVIEDDRAPPDVATEAPPPLEPIAAPKAEAPPFEPATMAQASAATADSTEAPPPEDPAPAPEPEPPIAQDDVLPDFSTQMEPATDPPAAPEPDGATGEDPDARFIALETLLFPGAGAPPPDPDVLAAAVRAVLDHPEMDQIDRSANVEFWLASLLCDAEPNSDPVLPMVIEHFHWDRKAGHWDQPELFEALLQRRNAFRLLDQLAYRGHPLHAAWRDLTSDKPEIGLTPLGRRSDVASLLYKIRAEAPPAEAYLNPHRVALWDGLIGNVGRGGRGETGLNWIWIAVIALFMLGKLASTFTGTSTHQPSGSLRTYGDPAVYFEPMIRQATGNRLGIAQIEAHNRDLHARLISRWQRARDINDQTSLLDMDLRDIINGTIRATMRGGSRALQADYWRVAADQLIWLRARDVDSCDRVVGGAALPANLPAAFAERRREIAARALDQEPPADPPAEIQPGERSTYRIPGAIFDSAARSAGLAPDDMDAALNGRGTAAQRCTARISLIEAAIRARGAQGTRLLRDMSKVL